jgi:hypothetical protein
VTVNASVRYANGDPVSNLTLGNFIVYDNYSGTASVTSISSFLNFTGYYIFNITSYSGTSGDTQPGIHNIALSASNNEGGAIYSGNSVGNDYYFLVVPMLVVSVNAPDDIDEGESKSVTINVSNMGTDAIYNVTITVSSTDVDSLTLASSVPSSCQKNGVGSIVLVTSSSTVYLNYSEYVKCTVVATGQDVTGDNNVDIEATAYGNHSYLVSPVTQYTQTGADTIMVNYIAGTTTTTGGGGGTTRKCTSDVSCLANETCSSSKICVSISCPNGQIVNRTCVGSAAGDKIGITSFDAALESISGGTASTKVTVKNTGTTAYVAKLSVTISGITADVTPTGYSLGSGESYQFTVNFTVPNTTAVGNFSGTFKAYVSSNTSAYESKSFTFSVLPTEQTKSEINVSYGELSSVLSSLIANLSQMKASGRYNQSVISSIEELINSANSTLSQIKSAIDSDDYISANSLISQVNTSVSTAEAQIQTAQLEVLTSLPAQYGIWFWVAVGVIIIFVVGFFVYMFYPSSHTGYHPEKGYAHPEVKEGLGTKIKKLFKRKKKEPAPPSISTNMTAQSMEEPKGEGHYDTFHYSEGYKKEKSYDYQYPKGGAGGLFQRFRRKNTEKTPQMHLDQFAGQPDTEEKKSE